MTSRPPRGARRALAKARLLGAAGVLAASSLAPAGAHGQTSTATAMDGRWHFLVAPYVWAAGMKGTVGVAGAVEVPVDESFTDTIENLDFGFLGRFEGRKDRIGFVADLAYLNLGAEVAGPIAGQVGLGADLRTLTVEGVLAYRVAGDETKGGFVDLLGGARYMGNRAALAVERGGDEVASTEKSLSWTDALAGARFRLPLSRTLGLHGRADVAGLGSDWTWNVVGGLDVAVGRSWVLEAGYRRMSVDYDKGQGLERRVWSMTYQGPYLVIGRSW